MSATKKDIRCVFEKWFSALTKMCEIESPWCFLCLCALIDYLANAADYPATKNQKQRDRYVPFIESYFPAKYRNFKYKNGRKELPDQMYYVLRNGVVHSFSLLPDQRGRSHGGRDRSIVLAHRANSDAPHLSSHTSRDAPDASLFIAEDFLEDTKKAAYKLLHQAKKGSALEQSILKRFSDHPPIAWKP